MVQTELRGDEAVLLAHALVCRLAELVGTRVLFIKGPTAVAVGARPDRPSQDVDVLVDPEGFDRLCVAIAASGWKRRVVVDVGHRHLDDVLFDHSTHFIHDEWPCDLDVHFNFPGFLDPADQVFDALWAHHIRTQIAGVVVTAPDLAGHVLVVALHALRNPDLANSRADLHHVRTLLPAFDEQLREALADLADQTGALEPMRTLLEESGVALPPRTERPGLAAWQWRASGHATGANLWLTELRRAPWRQKMRTFRNAVLPSRDYILSAYPGHRASQRDVAVLHAKRWARGIRSLPGAMKGARRRPK